MSEIIIVEETIEPIKTSRGRGRPRKDKPSPPPEPEPKERKPRKRKEVSLWRDDRKTYFNNYFKEKLQVLCKCDICDKTFLSKTGLAKHTASNKTCTIIKGLKDKIKVPDVDHNDEYNEFD